MHVANADRMKSFEKVASAIVQCLLAIYKTHVGIQVTKQYNVYIQHISMRWRDHSSETASSASSIFAGALVFSAATV